MYTIDTNKKGEMIMHSDDFEEYGGILNGKTKKEWEKEFQIEGLLYHLHQLGWETYQWYREEEDDVAKERDIICFAECFSPYYNGYLRGDSSISVKEAVEQCLRTAQLYAACENRTGHHYTKEKNSSYASCTHCGFDGFSSTVQTLQSRIKYLEIQLKCERECNQKIIQNANKEGIYFNASHEVIKK